MPDRSENSPDDISSPMPTCSGGRSRWISASVIAGVRMNRICCCRSGCLTTARGPLRRRHRLSRHHRRLHHRARESLDRRRRSSRSRAAASSSGANAGQLSRVSPAHALARLDEGGGVLGFGAAVDITPGDDDDDEQGEHGEQVDVSDIVTVVADFPAHYWCPPSGRQINASGELRVPRAAAMRVWLESGTTTARTGWTEI